MQKLNVIFAADYIAPSPGAFIRSLELLSERLVKNGGSVAFLFSTEREYLDRLKKYGNVYICAKTANKRFSFTSLKNMFQAIKSINSKVIHIHFLGLAYLVSAIILKFWYQQKIVVHYRNPPVSLLENKKLFHKLSPLFYYFLNLFIIDRNIVISRSIKEMLVAKKFVPSDKISVIYNGIDQDLIKDDFIRAESMLEKLIGINLSGRFVVGMIANFSPQKDHYTVIRAASILVKKFPEIIFIFVGSEKIAEGTGYMEKAKSFVAENRLEKYVYFAGEIKNIYEIIPRFDIGILISNFEGFGNALVEYSMAGKPVIGTKVGGIEEIIEDGKNGFLINPGDYQGLAQKIELLVTDRRVRNEIGDRAKIVALERFSIGTWVNNVITLYEKILSDK